MSKRARGNKKNGSKRVALRQAARARRTGFQYLTRDEHGFVRAFKGTYHGRRQGKATQR